MWFHLSRGFQICKFTTVSLLCSRLAYLLSISKGMSNRNSKLDVSKTRTVDFPLQTYCFPTSKIIFNISKLCHSSKCIVHKLKGHSWKIIFLIPSKPLFNSVTFHHNSFHCPSQSYWDISFRLPPKPLSPYFLSFLAAANLSFSKCKLVHASLIKTFKYLLTTFR